MMRHMSRQRPASVQPASVQPSEQPSKSCSDYCEKDFTFINLDNVLNIPQDTWGYSRNNSEYANASHRMILQQNPRESLTLKYKISYSYSSSYNCNLTLILENNLHEISNDYGYEIMLRALIEENGSSYHLPLLFSREMRTDKTVNFENREFFISNKFNHLFSRNNYVSDSSSTIKLLHVCCGIRRFKNSSINQVPVKTGSEFPLDKLFREPLHSDVRLQVGQREFQGHRAILSLRSSVFRAMFSHENTTESRTGVVKIKDIEVPVFEEMLRYVYTGHANEGISKFPTKLFKAAHKYDIAGLVAECEEALMFTLVFANVVEFLDLAKLYNLEILKRGAKAFIGKHEEDMVREPSYQEFLCRDLDSVDLGVDSLVYALKLCAKYGLPKVKAAAFEVVKRNSKMVSSHNGYLSLFKTHPNLMQEIFVYINK